MAKTDFKSVNDYLAAQPAPARAALKQVRDVIRKALPDAEEVISYQIPAYRLHDDRVIYFAGWKHHYSLYPVGGKLAAILKDDLAAYEVNNKGTVRFPLDEPVPARLIERIVKLRAREAADRAKTKKKAAPKTR